MAQIMKAYNNELISEVAFMCDDINFKDFKRTEYGQATFRAMRKIANEYGILEYQVGITIENYEITDEDGNDLWVDLPFKNFKAETQVVINEVEYDKVNVSPENENEYVIKLNDLGSYVINYYGKQAGDKVVISYQSLGRSTDESDGLPLLGDKYYEEILRQSVIQIAKIGIIRFREEKREKYAVLLRTSGSSREFDPKLGRDDQWIKIQPFRYP